MYYVIRWKQDFSKIVEFVHDEDDCAIAFETKEEAQEYINGHVIEFLLEIIEI